MPVEPGAVSDCQPGCAAWEGVFADLQVGSVVTTQHLGMRNGTHECPFRDEPYSGERGVSEEPGSGRSAQIKVIVVALWATSPAVLLAPPAR